VNAHAWAEREDPVGLIERCYLPVVQAYVGHIHAAAQHTLREALTGFAIRYKPGEKQSDARPRRTMRRAPP
jgi:hypothetical protein